MELSSNPGKNLIIEIRYPSTSSGPRSFARYPVKTKLITPEDKDISLIVEEYAKKYLEPKDIVFISEKAVAITQGRSYPIKEIKASKLAKFLSKFVTKTPIGIGLGSPETMQLALEEVGAARMLLAAFFGAIGKLFGIKGIFYVIAGSGARAIDGAVPYAIPPYNTYVSKGPINADKVAENISKKINAAVAIVDANDFGVNILGATLEVDKKLLAKALKDNPLGQTDECTPIGILREIHPANF
ncbi:MAG: coenzyme F420-0:L-glutamate ligase [Patescibacteria group bacterium]